MRQDHLKGAAGFPSDDGCHDPSSPVLTLVHPGPTKGSSFGADVKPPPPGIPQGPAPAFPPRPRQGQTPAQQDQVPLRPLPLPQPLPLAHPRLIRLAREEAQEALDRARVSKATLERKGPKPRLLVVLDLVTLEKRDRFPALPLSFFHGKWGLHLVVHKVFP